MLILRAFATAAFSFVCTRSQNVDFKLSAAVVLYHRPMARLASVQVRRSSCRCKFQPWCPVIVGLIHWLRSVIATASPGTDVRYGSLSIIYWCEINVP